MKICYPLNLPFNINQKFGEDPAYYAKIKDAFGNPMKGHNGLDFSATIGTPVYATHDGTVWFAGTAPDESLQVDIDTVDGLFRTLYGHLSSYSVTPGQVVKRGQQIGLSGNTGKYTTGMHLHFGLHPISNYSDTQPGNGFGGAIDPQMYFDGSYPSSPASVSIPALPAPYLKMLEAIRTWQLSEGLNDFQFSPLEDVRFGEKSKFKANKYITKNKYKL